MNQILQRLGLTSWQAIWDPDSSQPKRGQSFPQTRVILIHDKDPEAVIETLVHEALEVKLRGVLRPYREAINSLIQAFEKVTYQQKEDFLEDLTPFMLKAFREDLQETSHPEPEVEL